jgi:phage/plasmid-associated DNA primase
MLNAAKIVDDALNDPFTEDQLALRFSERHALDLRYVAARRQWYRWDGVSWAPERTALAFDLVRASCRDDASDYGNETPPGKLYTARIVAASSGSPAPTAARPPRSSNSTRITG